MCQSLAVSKCLSVSDSGLNSCTNISPTQRVKGENTSAQVRLTETGSGAWWSFRRGDVDRNDTNCIQDRTAASGFCRSDTVTGT